MPDKPYVTTTSPMRVLPDDCTMFKKPVITETTTMTRATHNATAATAISGINLLVRYRIVSLL
tara:strand:- start:625 stop:813 length:189 start_codon:yes stop_codon:yes gene_type:complete